MHAALAPVRVLRNEADYDAALAEFEHYFDSQPAVGSEDADRYELLGLVIGKYEADRFPMPAPTPAAVLQFFMDQSGRTQRDLAELFASRSRASEVLNGRRELTLDQIRKLHKTWGLPAAALLGAPATG